MERRTRSSIAGGVLLILLGILFLFYQVAPAQFTWLRGQDFWPLIIVIVGACLLIFGLVAGAPGMAIPACVVAGIGLMLFVMNATGAWASWAYAWALIPGFVGVGIILNGLLEGGRVRSTIGEGLRLILISLVLFAVFGAALGPLVGAPILLPFSWPVILIAAGVILLLLSLIRW